MFYHGLWVLGGPAEGRHKYFTMHCGTQEGRQRAGTRILRWLVAQSGCRRGPAHVFSRWLWHKVVAVEGRRRRFTMVCGTQDAGRGRRTYFTMVCGTEEGRQRAGARVLQWFVAQNNCRGEPAHMFHDGLWHPGWPAEGRRTYFTMVCDTQEGRQRADARLCSIAYGTQESRHRAGTRIL